jgi:hypothetical protein
MRGKLHVRICEGGVERSTPPLDPYPGPITVLTGDRADRRLMAALFAKNPKNLR